MAEKRQYEKPTMKVVPVNFRSQILAGSPGAPTNSSPWGDGGSDNDSLFF